MARASLLQDARPRLKFAFIHRYRGEYELKTMCRVLGVSRGGYYTWVKRQEQPPARREMSNQQLTAAIQTTFKQSRGTYGAPRIHAELKSQGVECSRPLVARLMRRAGITKRVPGKETTSIQGNHHAFQAQLSGRSQHSQSPVLGMSEAGADPTR